MADPKQQNGKPVARPRREGMARIGSVANAPWFNLKNGNKLFGVLLSMHERPDERSKTGKSKFFQVELLDGCEARLGRGDKAKLIQAVTGQIINLNYGPKTKDLEQFIPKILRGGSYEIECIVNGEKFDIGKGQTMWPIEIFASETKAPRADDEPDFGDDDEEEKPAAAPAAPAA